MEFIERVVVDSRERARKERDDRDVVVRILDRREKGPQFGEPFRDRERPASRNVDGNAERLEGARVGVEVLAGPREDEEVAETRSADRPVARDRPP